MNHIGPGKMNNGITIGMGVGDNNYAHSLAGTQESVPGGFSVTAPPGGLSTVKNMRISTYQVGWR